MTDLRGNNGVLLLDNAQLSMIAAPALVLEMADWLLRNKRYLRAELPMRDQDICFYMKDLLRICLFNGDMPVFEEMCTIVNFSVCDHNIVRAEIRPRPQFRRLRKI